MLRPQKSSRPDYLLKRSLLFLSYSLVILTIVMSLFLRYPEYFLYLNLAVIILTIICLLLTVLTLRHGEEALSYGEFANEMIKKNPFICQVANLEGYPVIQNDKSRDFFAEVPVVDFLEKHLSDSKANAANFRRLKNAAQSLKNEEVEICLDIFDKQKTYLASVHPLLLRKINIFEDKVKINKVKNDAYLFWNFEDITSEKNIEQVFFEERKYLHDFLDYLPVGIYTCDKEYNIEYANEALGDILGIPCAKVVGMNLKNFVPDDCDFYNAKITFEGRAFFSTNDNTREVFIFQESVRENKKVKIRGVVLKDIPNDKDLMEELYHSSSKLKWLFEASPVAISFMDNDGTILSGNRKMSSVFKKSDKELIGANIFSLITQKDDIIAFKKTLKNIEDRVSQSSFTDVRMNLGDMEKTLRIYVSPMEEVHTKARRIDGFVLYFIDATEQKNLEIQFAQAQKMQAMGQLAGGVAHDFNNLLTAVIGFCDLLLQKHGVGDPSYSDLTQIRQNAIRAARLVRQLLAFSRKQPLKLKPMDVTENFADLNQMLKMMMGEQIELKFHHGQDLGLVRFDPVQFSQVFLNLAVNAKDAMNGKGTLSISTRCEKIAESFQFGENTINAGEFVVIDVADTGCGISKENLNRIFEPFFSTKQNSVGSGTGLGLATVYGIIQQSKGFIKVDSKLGKGTTFSIYLPKMSESAEEIDESETKEETPLASIIGLDRKMILGLNVSSIDTGQEPSKEAQGVKILFVEDEDSVRAFAVKALEKKGFNVTACNSAENALEHLGTDAGFKLLITDMVMPGINGAQLAVKVKEKIPDIKILLASGYSEEIARSEIKTDGDFEFIAKPFSLGDLTKKVFDLLEDGVK